ncbi:hypothetical protein QYQ99_09455 [Comamonas testosteroni]|uniref:hypothetical protein n=1 Tax=Comamonas testosteroni TaxID=285 RepID=UPI00265F8F27|nr:hypothetical protein [Comamonas testosteroni]WKL17720.1 hypothetical protein QYQ99_09455 [Comamonas testosteroni]
MSDIDKRLTRSNHASEPGGTALFCPPLLSGVIVLSVAQPASRSGVAHICIHEEQSLQRTCQASVHHGGLFFDQKSVPLPHEHHEPAFAEMARVMRDA